MKKEKYDIEGMHCVACSNSIENFLKKQKGVKEIHVNLLNNNMIISYDEAQINTEKIISLVSILGYKAMLTKNDVPSQNNDVPKIKKRFFMSLIFLVILMYFTMGNMIKLPFSDVLMKDVNMFYVFQIILVGIVMLINREYYSNGFRSLKNLQPNMNSLVAISTGSTFLFGMYIMWQVVFLRKNYQNIYFDSVATVLTLITFGKYLETKSKSKTSESIKKLLNLAPKKAIIEKDGKECEIATKEIKVGDIVCIKPGMIVPVDGKIIFGNTYVNQAAITGESVAVAKDIGDKVISATINTSGFIKVVAEKIGEDTVLSQIIRLVEDASTSKVKISKLTDKLSAVFVPTILIISLVTFVVWYFISKNLETSINFAVSVLIVSCPCAIGLAIPTAVVVAIGMASEKGILIKNAETFEKACTIDTVVFDKTGTITEGHPVITNILTNIDRNEFISIIACLEQKSNHPLARIIEKLDKNNKFINVTEFIEIPGKGISGIMNNKKYFVGNEKFLLEQNINLESLKYQDLLKQGKTLVLLSNDKELLGIIALSDKIKNTSKDTITKLNDAKIETIMLSGDNEKVCDYVCKELQIKKAMANLLPQEKIVEIEKLQKENHKILMVGDGINDAPSLTKADLAVAIGNGSDIAIDCADVILTNSNLNNINFILNFSQKVMRCIKQNIFWAFVYNLLCIPIAAGLFYRSFGLKLNPMICGVIMCISSFCVVSNSLRIKTFK